MEFPSHPSVQQLLRYTCPSLPFHSETSLGSVAAAALLTLALEQGQKSHFLEFPGSVSSLLLDFAPSGSVLSSLRWDFGVLPAAAGCSQVSACNARQGWHRFCGHKTCRLRVVPARVPCAGFGLREPLALCLACPDSARVLRGQIPFAHLCTPSSCSQLCCSRSILLTLNLQGFIPKGIFFSFSPPFTDFFRFKLP